MWCGRVVACHCCNTQKRSFDFSNGELIRIFDEQERKELVQLVISYPSLRVRIFRLPDHTLPASLSLMGHLSGSACHPAGGFSRNAVWNGSDRPVCLFFLS